MSTADAQGALWSMGAEVWADLLEPFGLPLYHAAFDAMDLGPDMHLLDAGCGAGLALQVAAARGAKVTGLDAALGLLDVARRRTPDAALHAGPLEALPFADNTFDAVSAFNAVQFTVDPVATVAELARVARPGAPVSVVVWGPPEQCESRAVFAAFARLAPPPPGAPGPLSLSAPGIVQRVVADAGLTIRSSVDVPSRYEFADVATAVHAFLGSGAGRRAAEIVGDDAVADGLRGAFAPYCAADGAVRMDNVFTVVTATS